MTFLPSVPLRSRLRAPFACLAAATVLLLAGCGGGGGGAATDDPAAAAAVYVFVRSGSAWTRQACVKRSGTA
ncbi:MAG: hypothetical protein ACK5PW_16865 [Burkholderiales bacterium]|jgi:hypothetical protein